MSKPNPSGRSHTDKLKARNRKAMASRHPDGHYGNVGSQDIYDVKVHEIALDVLLKMAGGSAGEWKEDKDLPDLSSDNPNRIDAPYEDEAEELEATAAEGQEHCVRFRLPASVLKKEADSEKVQDGRARSAMNQLKHALYEALDVDIAVFKSRNGESIDIYFPREELTTELQDLIRDEFRSLATTLKCNCHGVGHSGAGWSM